MAYTIDKKEIRLVFLGVFLNNDSLVSVLVLIVILTVLSKLHKFLAIFSLVK